MSDKAEDYEDLFPDSPLDGGDDGAVNHDDGDDADSGADAGDVAGQGQDAADGLGDGGEQGAADTDGKGGKVPLGALKAVREEKKELAAKVETLAAQLAALQAAPAPVAPATAPAPAPTISQVIGQLDPLDPEYSVKLGKVIEYQTRQIETQTKLNVSREAAIREFGAEEVNAAFEFFNTRPRAESEALLSNASPFHAAVATYRKQKALSEIGDDPAAFIERTRQQVLAELQAQNGQSPALQVVTTRSGGGPSLAGQPNLGSRNSPEWSGPETLEQILGG